MLAPRRLRAIHPGLEDERATHLVDGGLVVAPVLHELRRQLYGVPFHPVDACAVAVHHGGQHVLQPVPELVEQGLHLAMAANVSDEGYSVWKYKSGRE